MRRAHRYRVLDGLSSENNNSNKIVLLEYLPNLAFRNTKDFRAILAEYRRAKSGFPLVIIVSEVGSGKDDAGRLFPPDFISELNIATIAFNSAANTNLVKVLDRVARAEAREGVRSFTVPDKTTLTALAESSNGDIRAAINALQFACLRGKKHKLFLSFFNFLFIYCF